MTYLERLFCQTDRQESLKCFIKNPEKRKLGNLLNTVNEGDTIIVTELSRLGRTMMMILDVLQKYS